MRFEGEEGRNSSTSLNLPSNRFLMRAAIALFQILRTWFWQFTKYTTKFLSPFIPSAIPDWMINSPVNELKQMFDEYANGIRDQFLQIYDSLSLLYTLLAVLQVSIVICTPSRRKILIEASRGISFKKYPTLDLLYTYSLSWVSTFLTACQYGWTTKKVDGFVLQRYRRFQWCPQSCIPALHCSLCQWSNKQHLWLGFVFLNFRRYAIVWCAMQFQIALLPVILKRFSKRHACLGCVLHTVALGSLGSWEKCAWYCKYIGLYTSRGGGIS